MAMADVKVPALVDGIAEDKPCCTDCSDPFDDVKEKQPVLLACGHSAFCATCAPRYVGRKEKDAIECSLCRMHTHTQPGLAPEDAVRALPKNFTLLNVLALLRQREVEMAPAPAGKKPDKRRLIFTLLILCAMALIVAVVHSVGNSAVSVTDTLGQETEETELFEEQEEEEKEEKTPPQPTPPTPPLPPPEPSTNSSSNSSTPGSDAASDASTNYLTRGLAAACVGGSAWTAAVLKGTVVCTFFVWCAPVGWTTGAILAAATSGICGIGSVVA